MSKYEKARKLAINGLEQALLAHKKADWHSIDDGLDEYDILIPREELPPNSLLFLALEFWSAWSDCAVHTWQFYEPLKKNDWPRLVKILLDNLQSNTEVTNDEIIKHFSVFSSETVLSKLHHFFKNERSD